MCLGQPERSFYASELIREAGTGSGAAQRELAKLEESGLIVARSIGHQKHYQANAASPLFSEFRNIVLKTVGLAEPLRAALKPLSSAIRAAFVYGSVAKATDQSASDIDLMIVSDSLTTAKSSAPLSGSPAPWVGKSTPRCTPPPSFQSAPGRKTRS